MTFQQVDRSQFDAYQRRLDDAYAYATKSNTHLWIATVAHRISDDKMATIEAEPLILDTESLLTTPAIGCYVCEQPYERRLLKRRARSDEVLWNQLADEIDAHTAPEPDLFSEVS